MSFTWSAKICIPRLGSESRVSPGMMSFQRVFHTERPMRRALVKQKRSVVSEIAKEFAAAAKAKGHEEAKVAEVWTLVTGFSGYAFNKAHSTAYGVEAYQAAWLKRYHPAEFMAGVLTNGKGFYHPLVYVLECHRLGLKLLPPSVNEPGSAFVPQGKFIRKYVPELAKLDDRNIHAPWRLDADAQRRAGSVIAPSASGSSVSPSPRNAHTFWSLAGFSPRCSRYFMKRAW